MGVRAGLGRSVSTVSFPVPGRRDSEPSATTPNPAPARAAAAAGDIGGVELL